MRQLQYDRPLSPAQEVRPMTKLITRTARIERGSYLFSPEKTDARYDGFTVPTTVLAGLSIPDKNGKKRHFLVTAFADERPTLQSRGRHHRAEQAASTTPSTIGKHTLRSMSIISTATEHAVMANNVVSIIPVGEKGEDGRYKVDETEGIIVHGGQGVTFDAIANGRVMESLDMPGQGRYQNVGDGLVAVSEKSGAVTITNNDMSTFVMSPDDSIRTFDGRYVNHLRPSDN